MEKSSAVRMSYMLNMNGTQIPYIAGQTVSGKNKEFWYFNLVENLVKYLTTIWGPLQPFKEAQANAISQNKTLKGIIVFGAPGLRLWDDAMGRCHGTMPWGISHYTMELYQKIVVTISAILRLQRKMYIFGPYLKNEYKMKKSLKLLFIGIMTFFLFSSCHQNLTLKDPFITLWKISDNDTIFLPLPEGFNYDFQVQWGDGEQGRVKSFDDPNRIHTYKKSGVYKVTITGLMESISFDLNERVRPPNQSLQTDHPNEQNHQNNFDKTPDKLISVINLGSVGWKNLNSAFMFCKSLASFSGGNTAQVTDMSNLFRFTQIQSLDLSHFDTSKVVNMAGMFSDMPSLKMLNIKNFQTQNVQNMGHMFANTSELKSLDLTSFNTAKVTSMRFMFSEMHHLKKLYIHSFNTEAVEDMSGMFSGATNLEELNLFHFKTSKVTTMESMFSKMESLKQLNLENFSTERVNNMSSMFFRCQGLKALDLSNFKTSEVRSMNSMFSEMHQLQDLYIQSFETEQVKNMGAMFAGATSLIKLDLSHFNTSNVDYMGSMFSNMKQLTQLNLSNWNTQNVINMNSLFYGTEKIKILDLSSFETPKLTSTAEMFSGAKNLEILYLNQFNFSHVLAFDYMFSGASNLMKIYIDQIQFNKKMNKKNQATAGTTAQMKFICKKEIKSPQINKLQRGNQWPFACSKG